MNREELMRNMLVKFGSNKQITQTIEELGELVQALAKIQRYDIDLKDVVNPYQSYSEKELETITKAIGELVDVETMLEQLRYLFVNMCKFDNEYSIKKNEVENKLLAKLSK